MQPEMRPRRMQPGGYPMQSGGVRRSKAIPQQQPAAGLSEPRRLPGRRRLGQPMAPCPDRPGCRAARAEHAAGRLRLDDAARRHAAARRSAEPAERFRLEAEGELDPEDCRGPALHRRRHPLPRRGRRAAADPKKKPVAALDGGAIEGGLAAGSGTAAGTGAQRGLGTDDAARDGPGPRTRRAGVAGRRALPSAELAAEHAAAVHAERHQRDARRTPPEKGAKDAGAKGSDSKDAGAALPAGVKTLERQAVDYVAAGDTAKAAAAYEELVRRDPNNKVYAEAARILRAKLDAGASVARARAARTGDALPAQRASA